MLAPAVMFIETAIDSMKDPDYMPEKLLESQRRELNSLGAARAEKIGADLNNDFRVGYDLGLATARIILRGSPLLMMKGIKPDDLL